MMLQRALGGPGYKHQALAAVTAAGCTNNVLLYSNHTHIACVSHLSSQ